MSASGTALGQATPSSALVRSRIAISGSRAWVLLIALRPRQWLKNGLLFVPLAFAEKLFDPTLVLRSVLAFACFCALASAGYILNDLADLEKDRLHPRKRLRPIASGSVSRQVAVPLALALAVLGIAGSYAIEPFLALLALSYLGVTMTYSLGLKHIILLDVFGIAAGFVIRAAAGAVAIGAPMSPWLYTATMLGAVLIGLGKRRGELQSLGSNAGAHRPNLQVYTVEFVDQLILIIASAALMTYALYTFSAENLPRNHSMMLTIPVVLYGLFRYLFIIRSSDAGATPEELLVRDVPLLASVGVWAVMAIGILYATAVQS